MSSVIPHPPNYVHDFGLRGYHIMSGIIPQPETDNIVLRDNDFQNQNQETTIDSLPYYHKDIKSSDEAIKFMKSKPPKVGQFIVRKSSKGKGFLSITVELLDRNIKHINIKMEKDETGRITFCLLKEMGKFDSLDSLIEFYRVNPIENIEKVKDVRLLYPIKKVPESLPRMSDIRNSFSDPFSANGNNLPSPTQSIDRQTDLANFSYTYVRNLNIDQSHILKMNLEKNEKCKCGISKLESRLPGNYTVHKAEYPNVGWKLYFQDSENKTAWTLPEHIILKMEPSHWKNLTKLYAPNQLPPWLLKKKPIFALQDEV